MQMFVALADRCARMTINPTVDHEWLNFNDIELGPAAPTSLGGSDPLDECNTSSHSADRGWELLRILLRLYDATPVNNYQHHIDVVDRIMSLRIDRNDVSVLLRSLYLSVAGWWGLVSDPTLLFILGPFTGIWGRTCAPSKMAAWIC